MNNAHKRISLSPVFKDFYNQLIEQASSSSFPGVKIDPIKICDSAIEGILKLMGVTIDKKGNLQFVRRGYIGRRIKSDELKAKIIDILSESVGLQFGYKDLQEKFYNAILSEKDKDEKLEEYLDCYAHDLCFAVNQAFKNVQAECYGLNTFLIQGDILTDSRKFCKDHINGVYNRKDLKKFEKMDWEGKNYDAPFEISRGGYNCRHWLSWIPDEAADYFRENS